MAARTDESPVRTPRRRARAGTAAVEAAVVSPIIVLLLVGMLEVGRLIEVQEIMNNAAREGARQAAAGLLTNTQVQQAVINYLNRAGLPTASATTTVSDLTSAGTDCSLATQNDQLQVTVSLPFKTVRWCSATLVTNSNTQLTATSIWYSARNLDYPGSISVPAAY
jgi:Flp pilus assembly protein TadG